MVDGAAGGAAEVTPSATKHVTCLACKQPREVESQKPGETKYRPCACGEVGIRVEYEGIEQRATPHVKKALRPMYEHSNRQRAVGRTNG